MQEEIIYLSNLDDNDLISVGATAYKIKKIRDVTENLLKTTYKDFSVSLNNLKANKLGICSNDNSRILDIYSSNYCTFEYLKIDNSNWETGKVKIYLSAFLYSKQSKLLEQNKSICYYPQLVFDDDDVVSFQKDCFCKIQSIKNAFKSISTNNYFVSKVMEKIITSFSEFTSPNLFKDGKECELLRLGSARWEPLLFGIQFTIDAIEDNPINNSSTLVNKHTSPLDEIRNTSI
jgi:hypothetical protein